MSTALRYNLAWNYIWENYKRYKQQCILAELTEEDTKEGRHFNEFIREVRRLAESKQDIPQVKSNYVLTEDNHIVASGSFNS